MIGWLFPSRHRAWRYGRAYGERVGASAVVEAVGAVSLKGKSREFVEGLNCAFRVAEEKMIEIDMARDGVPEDAGSLQPIAASPSAPPPPKPTR